MTPAQKQRLSALSLRDLKKEAWSVFSEWIRRRYANDQGLVPCCSCGKVKHWKQMQAGHWPQIAGRHNSVLFVEKGVHAQCGQCNTYKNGNPAGYDEYMRTHYSEEEIEELRKLPNAKIHYEKADLIKLIDQWVKNLAELTA